MQLGLADVDRVNARGAARQQSVGEAAGRGPDIEKTRPAGSKPKWSSAAASFTPPRDTYGCAGSARNTASAASSWEALVTGASLATTKPASIAACAWARLSNRPRSTSRRSTRTRDVMGVR
jgi:hypothetical protein